jgi:putative endonuclease
MNETLDVQDDERAAEATGERRAECFVYVLGSPGKTVFRTYVGWTVDLEGRLAKHNSGKGARSTRGHAWTLLYAERYAARRDAMSREWHLKRDRRFRKELSAAIGS